MVMNLNDNKGKTNEPLKYDEVKQKSIRQILKNAGLSILGIGKRAKEEIKEVRTERRTQREAKIEEERKTNELIRVKEEEILELNDKVFKLQFEIEEHERIQLKSDRAEEKRMDNNAKIKEYKKIKKFYNKVNFAKPKTLFGKILKLVNPEVKINKLIKENKELLKQINNQKPYIREKKQMIKEIENKIEEKQEVLAALRARLNK